MSDLEKFRKGYAAKRARKNKKPKFDLAKYVAGKRKRTVKKKLESVSPKDFHYGGMVPLRLIQNVARARCGEECPTVVRKDGDKVAEFLQDIRGAQMIYKGE